MSGRRILLGVTGSIAAYKAAELVRLFVKGGDDVTVVMTPAAAEFVRPLTFQTLSRNPVFVEQFAAPAEWKPEHVSLAMGCVKCAERPMDGALVRVCLAPQGMSAIRRIVDAAAAEAKKKKEPFDENALELIAGIDSFWIGLGVSDLGLDFIGGLKPVQGTEIAKIGSVVLPAAPFTFAGADSIAASADCTLEKGNVLEVWKPLEDAIKRNGVDLSRFFKITYADRTTRVVYDAPAFVKYVANEATNTLAKIDSEKLGEDVKTVIAGLKKEPIRAASAPQNCMMVMAGYTPKFTAAQRFEATLPDAKGKRLVTASVLSLSALVLTMTLKPTALVFSVDNLMIKQIVADVLRATIAKMTGVSYCPIPSSRRYAAMR